MKLFMLLLGCRPKGRFTEQHDIFFGIAQDMPSLIPAIIAHWPEAKGKLHIDAWREVNHVNGFAVTVTAKKNEPPASENAAELFFVNLGGYKAGEFDEFHYKMIVAAPDIKTAQRTAMATTFFKHHTLPASQLHYKATAHIDDKYGIDVDDIYAVKDILPAPLKSIYALQLSPAGDAPDDPIHLGYLKLSDLLKDTI